jgi:hypothetical protein
VHIDVSEEVGTNESDQPIFGFDVESDVAQEFLSVVPHSFLPGRDWVVDLPGPDPWTGGR